MQQYGKKVFWSVVGLLLAFQGGQVFAGTNDANSSAIIPNPLGATNSIMAFITLILDTVFPIAGVISIFFLIFAGFLMVTAGGNEEKLGKARTTFLWTVIGVAILLGAKVLSAVICGTVAQLGTLGLTCPRP